MYPSKYDTNTYVQTGMVARGIGCAKDETPGVYASVSKALCSVCLISMETIILTIHQQCVYVHICIRILTECSHQIEWFSLTFIVDNIQQISLYIVNKARTGIHYR